MTHGFRRRGGPPWWPANEPWPPRFGPGYYAWRRFFRRAFLGAGGSILIVLAAMLCVAWLLVTRFGAPEWMAPLSAMLVLWVAFVRLAFAARRFMSPLNDVMEAADRVAAGDYAVRVDASGPAPMRALVRSFNTMAERLQDSDRVRRNIMTDIAHELRTPVAVLQGRLEGIIDGVYRPDERQLAELLEETRVLSTLIEDVRTLSLSDAGALRLNKESIDAAALARDVVRSMQPEAGRASVSLGVTPAADGGAVSADPVRLREVLTNLLSNALRHTPVGHAVNVSIVDRLNEVAITVADAGEGMSPEQLAHMFDRFYKGPTSRGSGLGLAIAKSIVTAHGGTIEASSQLEAGTTITFTLPR
jgi:signal transduction histidine kinase